MNHNITHENNCNLFIFIRSTYMGERMAYYTKRNNAMNEPLKYLSIISDGMAQGHCKLPWMANIKDVDSDKQLDQHLQGVYAHGRSIGIYRAFQNVKLTTNAQLHSFLLHLESLTKKIEADGSVSTVPLPETLFYQVDGGPENANRVVYAMMEFLVAKRLFKKIVLARLLVGHTHEDIDAKFAKIWKMIRSAHVLTAQQYDLLIKKALGSQRLFCEVFDVFVIPDYIKFLEKFIDPEFERFAKLKWTELEFTFEAVSVSDDFPLGVKVTYRPYCAEKAVLIVSDSRAPCQMIDDHLINIVPMPKV